MKLQLLGALAALVMPTVALAQDAQAPLPPPDLPSDPWDHGVACSSYVILAMLVIATADKDDADKDSTDDVFSELSDSMTWWDNQAKALPGYTEERFTNETGAFTSNLLEAESPQADQWTANVGACVSESEAAGADTAD